jgi:hypothetical protein
MSRTFSPRVHDNVSTAPSIETSEAVDAPRPDRVFGGISVTSSGSTVPIFLKQRQFIHGSSSAGGTVGTLDDGDGGTTSVPVKSR